MKYSFHSNGWTVKVHDLDVKNASQQEADEIAQLISCNIVVCIEDSRIADLELKDEVRFCEMIGEIKSGSTRLEKIKNLDPAIVKSLKESAVGNDEISSKVQRVTGEKNSNGYSGLFGKKEALDWHNNRPWDLDRGSIVWLRTIKGAGGSKTSWTNTIRAYEDLKIEDPNFVKSLEDNHYRVVWGNMNHTKYYNVDGENNFNTLVERSSPQTAMPLVFQNEGGYKGFFLPYLQVTGILGLSKEESDIILKRIWDYTMQEKYIYHHEWKDGNGEIILSEQWNSVHKRWEFENIEKRYLHRISFDYSNTTWWNDVKYRFNSQKNRALRENLKYLKRITK